VNIDLTAPAASPGFTVRSYNPADARRMAELQRKCLAACPEMDEMPAGFYENPAFDEGRNIFCAAAGAAEGPLVGYGYLYRFPDPRYLYLDIKADPEFSSPVAVKDALFERVLARAREVKSGLAPGLPTLLYGCYFTTGEASLAYLASKGFTRHEPLCVLTLERDLTEMVPKVPLPLGVELRPWPLETEAERVRYLLAHNIALPYNYLDLQSFEHLLRVWDMKTYGVFAGDEVVGSATVIVQGGAGIIEYLFVMPEWRGKGVGRALVRASLKHFMDKGLTRARLDTGTENTAARALYESMGYRVTREAVSMGLYL
jgi:ribosomal protein S18 acetylase RimI-like enzyme